MPISTVATICAARKLTDPLPHHKNVMPAVSCAFLPTSVWKASHQLLLHILGLQQVAALVGHHPWKYRAQSAAERREPGTDTDLSQINSLSVFPQARPFVLRTHELGEHLGAVWYLERRRYGLGRSKADLRWRLRQPNQKTT